MQLGQLTERSDAEGNQGGEALVAGQLHQSSILCLTQVQQLERQGTKHTHQGHMYCLVNVQHGCKHISIFYVQDLSLG